MTPPIFQFETEGEFWAKAKEDTIFAIKETLLDYEECRIGLAGGSTPRRLYEMLAEEDLPWGKIKLTLIDERYVPSDHPESNLGMIRKVLLSKIPIPPGNVLAFDTSLPAESAAKEMGRKIAVLASERKPIFDLLILGAGSDGHIASLFDGVEEMACSDHAKTARARGYDVEERLTLCLRTLLMSDRALLLLKGPEKEAVLDQQGTALVVFTEKVSTKVLACFN